MISKIYPNSIKFILLLVIALTYNACKTLKPTKPEENYVDIPHKRNISTINIPVSFSLNELEKQINKQVAGLIFEDENSSKRENLHLKVWKREKIAVSENGDQKFHIKVPLKVWVKADLNLKQLGLNISESKDTEFEIDLNFTSNLSIDSSYKVASNLSASGYDWVKKPKLKMGFLEISLGSLVEPYIKDAQQQISTHLNQQIQDKIDLKKHIQKVWTEIQKPLLISEEYQAWIKVKPENIHITPLHINNKSVNAIIGLDAYTETYFGDKPATEQASNIPPLQVKESVDDKFAITFSGEISQEKAKELIAEKFVGKNFSFKNGKKSVTITGIDLYGSGRDMIIEADITGSIDGKVFLSGKPEYDSATQSIIVPNLDYTLDTKSKLTKTANWLVKGRLVKNLEESLRIPLETHITKAKTSIDNKLNNAKLGKGVHLNGSLEDIVPSEVYMTENSIIALVKATGKAKIIVEGL